MSSVIPPVDQLFELNKEILDSGICTDSTIIVVGGQVIAYWLQYFSEYISDAGVKMSDSRSSDIDYMMSLKSARQCGSAWNVEIAEDKEHPPPQLAKAQLKDKFGIIKTDNDGDYFANPDLFDLEGSIEGNVVDFIDWPKGFKRTDFENNNFILNTVPFVFPPKFGIQPIQNLRILTPIACLKSRLENAFGYLPCKEKDVEAKRIEILLEPLELYIQEISNLNDFRLLKMNLDYLYWVLMSKSAVNFARLYIIDFVRYYDYLVKAYSNNPSFIRLEYAYQHQKLIKKHKKL